MDEYVITAAQSVLMHSAVRNHLPDGLVCRRGRPESLRMDEYVVGGAPWELT